MNSAMRYSLLDSYPFGGHHAREITAMIRKSLGASGGAPTMPRDGPGVVRGEELQLILAWADAYDRAHPNAAVPEKHHHDHVKSEHEHGD